MTSEVHSCRQPIRPRRRPARVAAPRRPPRRGARAAARRLRGRARAVAVLGASLALAGGALAQSSSSGGAASVVRPRLGRRGAAAGARHPRRRHLRPADAPAVRAFQRAHGLVVDGHRGPQTLAARRSERRRARARAPPPSSLLQRIARVRVGRRPDARSRPTAATAASTSSRARRGALGGTAIRPPRRSPCRTRWPRSCSRRAAPRPGPTALSVSGARPAPRASAQHARRRGPRHDRVRGRRPSSRPCWSR